MKRILTLVTVCMIATEAHTQFIKDKNAFARAFIKIFNQRANGFDSLQKVQGDSETLKNPSGILPQAHECYISTNAVFGTLYIFPDSTQAVSFFKELQELLRYTAGAYSADAVYEPLNNNPFNLRFYFRETGGYTENLMTIDMSRQYLGNQIKDGDEDEEEKDASGETAQKNRAEKNEGYEVGLLIHPGDEMSYFTSAGTKITDEALIDYIIKTAFGEDTLLSSFRTNKRTDAQKYTVYDSKISLGGFSTKITETVGKNRTGIQLTAFRDYISPTWEKFRHTLDSFILKMKAAMPADFVYQIFENENYIEFKPSAFAKYNEHVASIILGYSLLENKKNTYRIELKISRVKNNTTARQVSQGPPLSSASPENFLNENKKKTGVITTASGLQYMILKRGNGLTPKEGDECVFYTRGTLLNGTEFDNTFKAKQPLKGKLTMLIPGLQEGMQLMPAGSKFRFFIPPALGYGELQAGSIPAGSLLVYEVELIKVKKDL